MTSTQRVNRKRAKDDEAGRPDGRAMDGSVTATLAYMLRKDLTVELPPIGHMPGGTYFSLDMLEKLAVIDLVAAKKRRSECRQALPRHVRQRRDHGIDRQILKHAQGLPDPFDERQT